MLAVTHDVVAWVAGLLVAGLGIRGFWRAYHNKRGGW